MAKLGPNELSVKERCPYYRGVRKERLDCISVVEALYYRAKVGIGIGVQNIFVEFLYFANF